MQPSMDGWIEYRIVTAEGRTLARFAPDLPYLLRDLTYNGHTAIHILPLSEYEAEQEKIREQERLNHELNKATEEEAA